LAVNESSVLIFDKRYKYHIPESSIRLIILLKRLEPGFGIFMAVGDRTKVVSYVSSVSESEESDEYIEARSVHFPLGR